ncbi:UDP-2,4-diacetamido-2,4,6-trideoxy-beta-L-altropyranose hydrolase [Pseudoduganella sp. SL102]|uniref:UDP-2,4-diacetamido-2,4, 6-trideoxy-beta-L-altropyranose hydrolase n=1 Tax=Pseudoduganella sp. SL102 TaxID=2995154 RepID=UPI00248D1FFA|nr:UDP-2,4-diacetamido-2,4,6-trideoxy-beta-L-altropyranose hydrolase [Pseudoduganella sp. SL102]WBS02787.1 UDP-2,4-diacetamido-2,4,6-trideoxy-beta-L-altropyranose hydrolase [Pseudoduganella sp. SL102]
MRIAFRTDASLDIGSGHVMRCLTLAARLRDAGAEVVFLCREHPGNLVALLEGRGFAVGVLPAGGATEDDAGPAHARWLGAHWEDDARQTIAALPWRADWLVTDHYGIDQRWQGALRSHAGRILVIDDLADRRHDCDCLLDQNLTELGAARYAGLVPAGCTLLVGPHYALLQPQYAVLHARARPREGAVRRVLVFFGGVDRDGLTGRTVRAILALRHLELRADIVVGPANPALQDLREQCAHDGRITVHAALPSLAPLMMSADLAVGAGGATSWERLCLGLPCLAVTLAENQVETTRLMARQGLVEWLGSAEEITETVIADALARWCERGIPAGWLRDFGTIDGRGADRVSDVLLGTSREHGMGAEDE